MTHYYSTTTANGRKFSFLPVRNDLLMLQEDNPDGTFVKKVVKVKDGDGVTYKLMKTQITANGGAVGLFEFLTKAYNQQFMVTLADKVLCYSMDTVKAYTFKPWE